MVVFFSCVTGENGVRGSAGDARFSGLPNPYDPPAAPRSVATVVLALFAAALDFCAEVGACLFLVPATDVKLHSGARTPQSAHAYALCDFFIPIQSSTMVGSGDQPKSAISVAYSTTARRSSGVRSSSSASSSSSSFDSAACSLASLNNAFTRSESSARKPKLIKLDDEVTASCNSTHTGTHPPLFAMPFTRFAKSIRVVGSSSLGNVLTPNPHFVSLHAHPRSCVSTNASHIAVSTPRIAVSSSRRLSHPGYANNASHVSHRSKSLASSTHPLPAHVGASSDDGLSNHAEASRKVFKRAK